MDQEPPSEPSQQAPPEASISPEAEGVEVDNLPESLGFVETVELSGMRISWVEAMRAGSEVEARELATRYHLLAEELVNQKQGDEFARAQIGLIVATGLIHRDGGRLDDFLEDLRDAQTYAWNIRLDAVAADLETAIENTRTFRKTDAEVVETQGSASEQLAAACVEVLSEEDRAYLAAMPYDEALNNIVTFLLENGVDDPEEFLREKGILE